MEKYSLVNIVEVHTKDYDGWCAQILVTNSANPIQVDVVRAFISNEEKEYIIQYGKETPITELFKLKYDFFKKQFKLKFNSELIK